MESDSNASFDPDEARSALHMVSETRADLADRLITPWWYHPGLGLIVATLVVTLAAPSPGKGFVVVAAVLGLLALVTAYSRVTGLGFSAEYYRLAFAELVALLAVILAAMMLVLVVAQPLVVLAAAAVAFLATVLLGRRADATIRRKLREGPRGTS